MADDVVLKVVFDRLRVEMSWKIHPILGDYL